MSTLKRTADFLALRRSVVGLLGMIVLAGLGERLGERFLPAYLESLGGGVVAVGLYAMLKNLLGAVYSLPGGWLAELLGTKRSLLVFNLLAMVGYAVIAIIPSWPAVLVGCVFFVAWSAICLPATMALIARVVPKEKRAMGVSLVSLIRRVPMALGPLIGGILIDAYGIGFGSRLAFGGAIVMTLLGMLLQQKLIENDAPDGATRELTHPFRILASMSPSLRNLLAADILIRFCEQIPDAFVVLWCTQWIAHTVGAKEFGLLSVVETATAMLCYIPVAYFADRGHKKPFVLTTFLFFTAFPLVLMVSQSFWTLVGAFVVRGLKEFGEATRKSLIMDLAPDGRKAVYFGVYYLCRDVIVSIAALGGAWLWSIHPHANLITAAAFGALGTLWFAFRGRDLSASEPGAPSTGPRA